MKNFLLAIIVLISFGVHSQSLNVMTYNIRYATEQDGVNAWSKRKGKVIDLLKKYDPDIVGVQEALLSQIEDIISALPDYEYIGAGRDDGKKAGEFSAILYKKAKYKISKSNTFWLSESPDTPGSKSWDAAITRVATWARIKDKETGKSFFLINTHFDHIGKEAREKSAKLLKEKGRSLHKGLPLILMGDFNATRDDAPYKTITDKSNVTLIDPAPENPPGTFCSFEVNSIECIGIDYIFHSPEWASSSYQVIQDHDGKYYPSDHLPVSVKLVRKK